MKALVLTLAILMGATQTSQAGLEQPLQIHTSDFNQYVNVASPVTFMAIAKIKPENVDQFKDIVDGILSTMRAQEGNIRYDYFQSLENPTEFYFVEEWQDGQSMKHHMQSEAVGSFFGKAGPLFVEGFPKIIISEKR